MITSLPPPVRGLVPAGVVVLGILIFATAADLGGMQVGWTRAHLTFSALFSALGCFLVARSAVGRAREVMGWITAAVVLWALAELIRDLQLIQGAQGVPSLADVAFLAVLPLTAMAYRAALRGRLPFSDETAVYLDAAIVFLGCAAALTIAFGAAAEQRVAGFVDLAYGIFFLATALATLLLDVALLAERRLRGAYLILLGLILLGAGFLWRLAAPPTGGLHEGGVPQYFLSIGVVVAMLGTVTWNDLVDEHPAYARVAARIRAGLPIGAVAIAPVLLVLMLVQAQEGLIADVVGGGALGLLLITVAIRQTSLLRGRESAVGRERELHREVTQAEAKYRTLVEQQPGVVYLAEPGARGRWHYVSPQIEAMLGFTSEEWTSDASLWARQVHPDDHDRVMLADAAAGVSGRPQRFEYRMLSRDGREVWVLDDLNPLQPGPDQPALLQGILLDITEQKRAEAALRANEEQLRVIVETASYAFVGMDVAGRIVEWNQQAERIFGWTREEAYNRPLHELIIPPAQREAHRRGMEHYLATGEGPILSRRIEVSALNRDGREFPVDLTIWPVRTGGEVRFSALVDDITVRKQLEEQLREQALHDPLTGLANRVLFADRVQRALQVAPSADRGSVAILFVGLDDFKSINDGLGHHAGDELLVAVANRVSTGLGPADTAARFGGDEFAVLVEGSDHARPARLAASVLRLIAEPFEIRGKQVQITGSIGIAMNGPGGASAEELMRNADLAMSAAKSHGKGHSELYQGRMHREALRRLDLKAALESAIAEERLEVHYQPIVRLADGLITGFEALLRWFGDDDEPIPLEEVIPIAEESGLIVPIGRMVLQRACAEAREWQRDPLTAGIDIAVNVSAGQLESGSLVADVRAALEESGLLPSSLIVEMTESALIKENLPTIRALRELRALGVRLALDDFGTGYSSLSHLRQFPIDIVKIDRTFVGSVARRREGALVRSIIDLGRTMNVAVIAEGIETAAQADELEAMECTLGQGFYFGRAVPAQAARELLAVGRLPARSARRQRAQSA
ncbi:MAG: EAL domain-containing protein [Chloroflexota bacterium]|nr:EAL domain-containing protein [Chloroflexota bacterium]